METTYKPIAGYEGRYEIGDNGDVVSLLGGERKVLRVGMMSSGYKMVGVRYNGKQKFFSIHRLLALHFIPNPDNKPQVNHKDGNKLNSRLDNLEWVTQSENNRHAYDTGLKTYRPLHYKGKSGFEHNRSMACRCVETGEVFGSYSEAERAKGIGEAGVRWSIKNNKAIKGMHWEKAI